MSNYLFAGYEFSSELKADFKLQNLLQSQAGEEQQMSLKLLNSQNEGFAIATNTPHGQTPQFVLEQIIGGTTQNIITLDTSTSNLALNFNVDLGGSYKIQNSIAPTDDGDLANKLYVDDHTRYLRNNEINVNYDGGATSWIRRSQNTRTNVQIYGMGTNSMMLESTTGESAGIGLEGGGDQCTIWTAGDSGTHLNIQDEDGANSRVAYVGTNGSWNQVSSKLRKHSIKTKSNNEVLDRMMQLSVKSFGYKYDNKKLDDPTKKRIEKKRHKMHVGLILEEVFKLFPNCINDYYNPLNQKKRKREILALEDEIQDVRNAGINHNVLLCYVVMAFQEFVEKTNSEILNLKKRKK